MYRISFDGLSPSQVTIGEMMLVTASLDEVSSAAVGVTPRTLTLDIPGRFAT